MMGLTLVRVLMDTMIREAKHVDSAIMPARLASGTVGNTVSPVLIMFLLTAVLEPITIAPVILATIP